MGKNKRGRKFQSELDADLDIELDEYVPSDSDDDYDENEKMLLEKATKGRSEYDEEDENEEEVLKVHSSEDEEDEEEDDPVMPVGSDMDSDIEGKEDEDNLPDSKAWGQKRKNFYHTDYVDEDYGGFTRAEEEEAALLEEKEARAIQDRLLAELEDTDFSVGLINKVVKKEEELKEAEEEVIKTDLSKLSKREKLVLLEKESPEFMGLVNDFKERLSYAKDKLYPILELIKSGELPDCVAAKFVSTKYHITLNYCTNISFYLLLKAKRINIQTHPIIKRLVQYRKLLEQLDSIEEDTIRPQIETILGMKQEGKHLELEQLHEKTSVLKEKKTEKRKILQLLSGKNKDNDEISAKKLKKTEEANGDIDEIKFEEQPQNSSEDEEGKEDEDKDDYDDEMLPEEKGVEGDIGKRSITFEIAKNKGLTPHRKKEQRNPRVKNRNKYRKAKIRRKGQIREPRNEVSRYAGEIFGIKASVKKSIKLS